MSLLAEELVEEWLNRLGYFTIRGAKLGVHELDLLAIRPVPGGLDCRHVEVTASVRPMSYLCDVPKAIQKATGRRPKSAKRRSEQELVTGVAEWVAKKFDAPDKVRLRQRLAPGKWTRELVVHVVRHEVELNLLEAEGVVVHRLKDIVQQMKSQDGVLEGASGGHLLDLIDLAQS